MWIKQTSWTFWLLSGSCHVNRASNVEIGVACQIFVIVIFLSCCRVLQFGAHSRYYKGALTQKRSFLVICTTFRSDFHVGWKNSTLNSSFDMLSIWHEPDIGGFKKCYFFTSTNSQYFYQNFRNFTHKNAGTPRMHAFWLLSVLNYWDIKLRDLILFSSWIRLFDLLTLSNSVHWSKYSAHHSRL